MYLSKIAIPWGKSQNAYNWHDCLWQLFPHQPDAKRDFLFRVEHTAVGQGSQILMQSQREPNPIAVGAKLLAKRDYPLALKSGQVLRFILVANPVKTMKDQEDPPRKNKKGEVKTCRVPLLKEEQQREWLERKLLGAARLESITVQPNLPLYFRKKDHPPGKIVPVTFEGVLIVDQSTQLEALIINGIGPAKGFGCGLLSVARFR